LKLLAAAFFCEGAALAHATKHSTRGGNVDHGAVLEGDQGTTDRHRYATMRADVPRGQARLGAPMLILEWLLASVIAGVVGYIFWVNFVEDHTGGA